MRRHHRTVHRPPGGIRVHGARTVAAPRGSRHGATALAALATAVMLTLAAPAAAQADEEESTHSSELVEQSIALIANDAGDTRVAERIDDALNAPDKKGVDLALARRALTLVERPGEQADGQARRLLLDSLGGTLPSAPENGAFATGTETGTRVVLDEFKPARGISDGGDAVLLGLGVAAVGGGLWLSRRLRPPHTIRQLEHRDRRHREAS
ncbi:hypothetical protein [Streptomyces sp. SAI-090]|jgi:hypothetical protein|uniref:hypothetical protein n=1 Tax=Streptomyces sp. SAI-090 TaxID=2940545 RepID=UPI00247624BD|nr:hypothetical protein [Streptomyces sp. SAI-090]MDH6522311.1 hypothetical protein [Streptomyces sp. SAI-090]